MVHFGADPRRARRTGSRVSQENPGMAAGFETEIDLYRRAADVRASADPPRPHYICAGGNHHRPIVVERAEPAKYPGSHRGRTKNPPRLWRDPWPQIGVGA